MKHVAGSLALVLSLTTVYPQAAGAAIIKEGPSTKRIWCEDLNLARLVRHARPRPGVDAFASGGLATPWAQDGIELLNTVFGPADVGRPQEIEAGEEFDLAVAPTAEYPDETFTVQRGDVILVGTHNRLIHFPTWRDYEARENGRIIEVEVRDAQNKPRSDPEALWDPNFYFLDKPIVAKDGASSKVAVIGGYMPEGDNMERRLALFLLVDGKLRFERFLTDPPNKESWAARVEGGKFIFGHCYGHEISVNPDGSYTIRFEMVSEQRIINGKKVPYVTSIYEAKFDIERFEIVGTPRLAIDPLDFPEATKRTDENGEHIGYLIEGIRTVHLARDLLLGFVSPNDFCSDRYGALVYTARWDGEKWLWKAVVRPGTPAVPIEITDTVKRAYDATWVGRLSPYWGKDGELSANVHLVPNKARANGFRWTNVAKGIYRVIGRGRLRIIKDQGGNVIDVKFGGR